MVQSIKLASGRSHGIRFGWRDFSPRLAILLIAALLADLCAAEPALPPAPQWKSGSIRRSDDGTLQLVPAPRAHATRSAATGSHVPPKPTLGRGTRAVVNWSPPTTYEDGSTLQEPLKYKVYYGTRFNRYTKWEHAGGQTRLIINGLEPGNTYYFVVTAYTEDGVESRYSNAVAVRIVEP